ncbi:MAG: hypothetical protein ACI4W2_05415 [Eubacterium sp.]
MEAKEKYECAYAVYADPHVWSLHGSSCLVSAWQFMFGLCIAVHIWSLHGSSCLILASQSA